MASCIPWQGTNCCTPSVLTSRTIIPTTASTRNRMELEIAETSVADLSRWWILMDWSRNPLDLVRLVLGLRWCCSVKGQLGLLEMWHWGQADFGSHWACWDAPVIQMPHFWSRCSGHCESCRPCSPPKLRSLVWMWEELEGEGKVLFALASSNCLYCMW